MISSHSGPRGPNEEEQENEGDREGDHMEENSVSSGPEELNKDQEIMRQQESSTRYQRTECIMNPDVDSPLTCEKRYELRNNAN